MCVMMNDLVSGAHPRRLLVRALQSSQFNVLDDVLSKYAAPLPFALCRLLDMMKSDGLLRVYVVVDTVTNQLVAAGGCCEHCDGSFVEVGGAMVRWKGYGLQRMSTYVRVTHALAMNESARVFCIVGQAETSLKNRMRGLGFRDWAKPDEDLLAEMKAQGLVDAVDYMILDGNRIDEHRQSLIKLTKSPILLHRGTGDRAHLLLKTLLTGNLNFREALENDPPGTK